MHIKSNKYIISSDYARKQTHHICINSSILRIQYLLNLMSLQFLHFFKPFLFTLVNFIVVFILQDKLHIHL